MNSTPILVSDIPVWYQQLLAKAEVQLKKVLLGLKFSTFEELVAQRLDPDNPQHAFVDDHNSQDVGYSFLSEEKNRLKEFEGSLLSKIFDNEELNLRFHYYDLFNNPYPHASL